MEKYKILDKEYSGKDLFMIIAIAYMFGVICRLFWPFWAGGFEQFLFNGELIINTNDGFAIAEGARDMIAGFHQPNDLSPYGASMPTFTFLLCKILPFKPESIYVYMSVFLAPLIAAPIILIAREYKITTVGIVAALIATILPAYYVRTMAAYFDSDMLNVTLPLLVIWSLIKLNKEVTPLNFTLPAVFMAIYDWWYASSYSLNLAVIITFLLYTLVFKRQNKAHYMALTLMLFSIIKFNTYWTGDSIVNYILLVKLAVIVILYATIKKTSTILARGKHPS